MSSGLRSEGGVEWGSEAKDLFFVYWEMLSLDSDSFFEVSRVFFLSLDTFLGVGLGEE